MPCGHFHMGYLPALDQCAECRKVMAGELAFLSAEAGGVLCASCKTNQMVKVPESRKSGADAAVNKVELDKLEPFALE